jgi:putative transposase
MEETEMGQKIQQLAYEKRRYGYQRIHILLKRSDLELNHKKVYRILGLKVLKRGSRKRALGTRKIEQLVTRANQR